jgi:hypothetical protein
MPNPCTPSRTSPTRSCWSAPGAAYQRAAYETREIPGVKRWDKSRPRWWPEYGGNDGTLFDDWVELFVKVAVAPDELPDGRPPAGSWSTRTISPRAWERSTP